MTCKIFIDLQYYCQTALKTSRKQLIHVHQWHSYMHGNKDLVVGLRYPIAHDALPLSINDDIRSGVKSTQ